MVAAWKVKLETMKLRKEEEDLKEELRGQKIMAQANVKLEERTLVEADPDEEEALPTYTEVIDGAKTSAKTSAKKTRM